jgi:hypothetical protein
MEWNALSVSASAALVWLMHPLMLKRYQHLSVPAKNLHAHSHPLKEFLGKLKIPAIRQLLQFGQFPLTIDQLHSLFEIKVTFGEG